MKTDIDGDGKIDRGELETWEREEREREKRGRDQRLRKVRESLDGRIDLCAIIFNSGSFC